MLIEERYNKILEIVEKEKYISAEELSHRLYVSLPTIRRDLAELHRRGLLLRSRGGARQINTEHTVMPLDFRKTQNPIAKRKLCQAAAELIRDNDIVFLDSSTTLFQIVNFLTDKKSITVVTNSIPLSILLNEKGIRTFCAGGELQESSLCFAGSYTEEFLQNFNIDIMFFSSYGVSNDGMIQDVSLIESRVRKIALKCSKRTVFLSDRTKLGRTAPYNLLPLNKVDCVITDAQGDTAAIGNVLRENLIFI